LLPEGVLKGASSCQDLMKCAYNLNEFELEVYRRLSETGPVRADDLAKLVGKERSTVYRTLQKLMSCGICYRETKALGRGGYYHVYVAIGRGELKKKLEQCVENWHEKMRQALSKFGEGF
jgi:predicted transcriptional regulator